MTIRETNVSLLSCNLKQPFHTIQTCCTINSDTKYQNFLSVTAVCHKRFSVVNNLYSRPLNIALQNLPNTYNWPSPPNSCTISWSFITMTCLMNYHIHHINQQDYWRLGALKMQHMKMTDSKIGDWKVQDWKMTDKISGWENACLENDGQCIIPNIPDIRT